MDQRTTGLVLRTRPLTESSLIVHWVTRDFGRLSTVAKGARRPKSPFLGKLDLFYLAELSYALSRRSDLHTLREVRVLDFRAALRRDVARLQQAAYFAQLLEQTTEPNTPIPHLYELLARALDALARQPCSVADILKFELDLLAELGLTPEITRSTLSAGARNMVQQLIGPAQLSPGPLVLSPSHTGELETFLHGFLIYHLGRVPKSRHAALHAG